MVSKHRKILLVEDSQIAMQVNTRLLEEIGCTVEVAENCAQAFSMATEGNHDLIFMDIGLPDGNGIDITAKIRGVGKKMPIVALTCYELDGEDAVKERCLEAGMNDVTRKPTTADILENFITTYVD